MNTIEERLWNYIDGTCPADEQKAIEELIARDETYKRKYEELLSLNQEFSKMELDEPSMAFTYNVMEAIRTEHAQQPLKARINQNIIRGIAAFFVLTIFFFVVYALSTVHLSSGSGSVNVPAIHLPDSIKIPNLKNLFSGPVLQGFLFFDVVLGLYLLDSWLRRKSVAKEI